MSQINRPNNRKRPPKWLYIVPIIAVIFIVVAVVCKLMLPASQDEPADTPTTTPTEPQTEALTTEPPVTEAPTEPATEAPTVPGVVDHTDGVWNLRLVNPTHSLPEGFTVDTAVVQNGYEMDKRAADFAKAMIAAAKKDGVSLLVSSGVRTHARQVEKYNGKVQEYINEGYSKADAEKEAATIIAYPGTSEHESGLALDILTPSYQRFNEGFEKTEAFDWLYEHCKEYGFILRYPKDKQDITQIIYEPWHYRYVGTEYSYKIMESGLCLEEFLEQ